jgi:hypothetical protein
MKKKPNQGIKIKKIRKLKSKYNEKMKLKPKGNQGSYNVICYVTLVRTHRVFNS